MTLSCAAERSEVLNSGINKIRKGSYSARPLPTRLELLKFLSSCEIATCRSISPKLVSRA